MDSLIPATANIAFWINAKFQGKITDSDFANACESLIGFVLPRPSTPAQVSPAECALDRHSVLSQKLDKSWEIHARENSLVSLDPTAARLALYKELEQATVVLAQMATLGSRADIDDQLASMYSPHLPALDGKLKASLDMALRIRLVCLRALEESSIPSSPSSQSTLTKQLRQLDDLALSLICAIASNP